MGTINFDERYCHLKARQPIITLTKYRSPHITEYYEDPEDDWFIFVITKARKSGTFTHCSIVIRKDVPSWVSYAVSQGWKIIENRSDLLDEKEEN
jgi:hypothetical protein